jgi:hypothetical protein
MRSLVVKAVPAEPFPIRFLTDLGLRSSLVPDNIRARLNLIAGPRARESERARVRAREVIN